MATLGRRPLIGRPYVQFDWTLLPLLAVVVLVAIAALGLQVSRLSASSRPADEASRLTALVEAGEAVGNQPCWFNPEHQIDLAAGEIGTEVPIEWESPQGTPMNEHLLVCHDCPVDPETVLRNLVTVRVTQLRRQGAAGNYAGKEELLRKTIAGYEAARLRNP